ncbi:guanylate kinase [Prevotella sp. KH2C16]|uniref:guanylate kinase n=1 Tax=Prevotella sp. KH2C16 TaxID=1855325 RepID=UPI0008E874F4|nr:guanylate kinase [Prevotella sp. KH2C16]SFG35927.1 guanylate kinase [Prevotella sp. KH2C16]
MRFRYETTDGEAYQMLLEKAKWNRNHPTQAEALLWKHLVSDKIGAHFRRQHPICGYIPDFVCLRKKLIIEIDGGYHFEGEQPEKDAERTRELQAQGYKVIRFSNEEVYSEIDKVLQYIRQAIMEIEDNSASPVERQNASTRFKESSQSQRAPSLGSSQRDIACPKEVPHAQRILSPEESRRDIACPKEAPHAYRAPSLGEGWGRLIIFSAPSGSGKSTLVQWLMREHPELKLAFSVSCTSRAPRGTERDGVEYFFLTPGEFRKKIQDGEFLEYEEVYADRFYGTLKSQVETQTRRGENVVFDVDVKGGCNIKQYYGSRALSIFVQAPSIEELERRLRARNTDSEEAIKSRLAKASYEMTFAPKFDHVVVNDDLERAKEETYRIVKEFLNTSPSLPKGEDV